MSWVKLKYLKTVSMMSFTLFVISCAITPQPTLQYEFNRLFGLDKQHFLNKISIKDDQFEKVAVISTQFGYIQNYPHMANYKSDAFLRGYIDKKTGVKKYQVYVSLKHRDKSWLFPYQAAYGRPLKTVATNKIAHNIDCGRYLCTYEEDLTFDVEEKELRRIEALTPEDAATKSWQFKIKNKSGPDAMEGFNLNEIWAFLEVMDNYKPVEMLK